MVGLLILTWFAIVPIVILFCFHCLSTHDSHCILIYPSDHHNHHSFFSRPCHIFHFSGKKKIERETEEISRRRSNWVRNKMWSIWVICMGFRRYRKKKQIKNDEKKAPYIITKQINFILVSGIFQFDTRYLLHVIKLNCPWRIWKFQWFLLFSPISIVKLCGKKIRFPNCEIWFSSQNYNENLLLFFSLLTLCEVRKSTETEQKHEKTGKICNFSRFISGWSVLMRIELQYKSLFGIDFPLLGSCLVVMVAQYIETVKSEFDEFLCGCVGFFS